VLAKPIRRKLNAISLKGFMTVCRKINEQGFFRRTRRNRISTSPALSHSILMKTSALSQATGAYLCYDEPVNRNSAPTKEEKHMASYTVEDIEILREKSGISYEEAVNLLEYHNGSLRNNKHSDYHDHSRYHGRRRFNVFNALFRLRVKVFKDDTPIINLSLLFMIIAVLVSSWLVILSAVAALLLGYRFAIERDSDDFKDDTLENMVKHAGSNVKNAAFNIARDINKRTEEQKAKSTETQDKQPEPEKETRSESPASGTTPVNVQFSEDGDVHVTEDKDGYHEADI
jgi:NACalpha-BTF3-like transcription factor